MKKIKPVMVILIMWITACGGNSGEFTEDYFPAPLESLSLDEESAIAENTLMPEDATVAVQDVKTIPSGTKILIAYFTWAENTVVTEPSAIDVDAVTSASVLPPGNTAKMADWIQQETGGDLFQIVTTEPYPSGYDECLERAAGEKAVNASHVDRLCRKHGGL